MSKQWEEITVKLQQARGNHGAVVLPNNSILITGGLRGSAFLDSTEVINFNSNLPNLPSKRGYHASAIVNNNTYVIGGQADLSNELKSVQRLNVNNPETGWQNVANMNQTRVLCAAAVHKDTIFVFGGWQKKALSTVEFFNTDTATNNSNGEGEWNNIQNQMKIARCDHAAITVGDIIYIIGGRNSRNRLNSVEMFDTSSRTFQEGPPLPVEIDAMSAVSVGKLIIITGGNITGRRLGESYVLHTTAPNPQWEVINIPLQTPRCFHTAVLTNDDKLCVCGGIRSTGGALDSIETISIVDFLPPGLLDMTALHASCCDLNATVDTIQRLVEADPSALSHQDVTGRTPVQRFLLCRGLFGDSSSNDTEEEEEALPSLLYLLENGIKSKELNILFILKKDFVADLLIRDESTNLVPFMSAATMSTCGLDVVYTLIMEKPHVVKNANGEE